MMAKPKAVCAPLGLLLALITLAVGTAASAPRATLANDGSSALYPLTTGPEMYAEQKVVAPDGEAYDYFGRAVALSGDTALLGAEGDDIGAGDNQGSAYVFARTGTTWSLQQKLTAYDGEAADHFGSSVALSGDTAIVGAAGDNISGNSEQGSAYVFVRNGTTWSLQQKLTASDSAPYKAFGASVALWGDTALIGAWGDDVNTNVTNLNQGSAYVFVRSGTTWSEQAKLTAWDGAADDNFGISVALSDNTAVVGAYLDDIDAKSDQGSAYVFVRSGATWNMQHKLTGSDSVAWDHFAYSVALSNDTALVGASRHAIGANEEQGSAYVFTRNGTTWTQQTELTASDGQYFDHFGESLALARDTALVGAYLQQVGPNFQQGSAYVFTRSGAVWSLRKKLTASDGTANDGFGVSAALSDDAALVGTINDVIDGNLYQGSAYFYVLALKHYLPLVLAP